MKNDSLDLILPCYNPIQGWEETLIISLRALQAALPQVQITPILVNDGSSQGITATHIHLLQKEFPQLHYVKNSQNRGKGFTVRKGVENARGELCIFTDIDFPYTLESILEIYGRLASKEVDIAVGIKDADYYKHLSPFRVGVSKGLRWLARTFLDISITDTQCGLKGFNARGKAIFLETSIDRYLCDLEFIYLADHQEDISMKSFPVHLKEGVEFSTVDLRILFREGLNFLKILRKTKP